MSHHGVKATHGIRYKVNLKKAKVLDLSDPKIAAKYGYKGGPISSQTQMIGARALDEGYNVIKFNSLRGKGVNYAVLDDFNELLTPKMITPTGK